MKINSFLLFISFIFTFLNEILTHSHPTHTCAHDSLELEKQVPKDFTYDFGKRRLAGGATAPIRITVDYSDLDNAANGGGMTPAVKDYLIRITEAVRMFFTNALVVVPRTTPVKKFWTGQCIDMNVPAAAVSPGISNSDLHLLVTYNNDNTQSYLANAGWCQLDPNPTVGRIKYNLGTMTNINTTPEAFEGNFWTALHETTHVLGFSQSAMQYWIDPDTSAYYAATANPKLYELRTVWTVANVPVLKSKKVVAAAQAYYNCPTIDGVNMENQGGGGSFGSHWERDLIANEYMTASAVIGKTNFSVFTAALLLDTGYYADFNYNFVEPTYFGKGKGCGFFTQTCKDTPHYPEFAYTGDAAICDWFATGYSYSNSGDPFSQCAKFTTYSNQICNNPTTATANTITRQIVGASTKCFVSSAIQKTYSISTPYRCHKISCAADYSYIDVILTDATEIVRCTTPGQVINFASSPVSATVTGSMTCPTNFQFFCSEPKYCKNSCSQQGFCNNVKCYCLPNYAGEDCSINCPAPNVYDGTNCVVSCPVGTFLNPDNVCRNTCFNGFYGDNADQKCKVCNFKCSLCTGPNANQCSACTSSYTLTGTTCGSNITCDGTCLTCTGTGNNQCSSCNPGFYLTAGNQCLACTAPCATCQTAATTCLSCTPPANYNYNSGNNTCTLKCDSSCLTCNSANNANDCASCNNGFFLNASKQCVACTAPCATCITTATTCQSCTPPANYNYNSGNNTCTLKCDASCLTCNSANNANDCASCNNGFFLNASKQCVACTPPCATCITTATTCQSCTPPANYNYNSGNNTCTLKCDASCLTCNSANNASDCASCNNGFFLNASKQCIACTAPCATCITAATTCQSCTPPANYTYNSGNNTCTLKCDSSCLTCNSANNANDCSSCNNGFFLNASKQCVACTTPCATCQTTATTCLSCTPPASFTYNSGSHTCTPLCDSSCLTCNSPNNANDCASCNNGFYLNASKQCVACTAPCATCTTTATTCQSCTPPANYTYNSGNNTCTLKCDSSCLTCNSANNANDCASCNNGFFLNASKQCVACTAPCATCQTSATTCYSCTPPANYTYNSGNNTCTLKCDSSCLTCNSANNASDCASCNNGFFLNASKQCVACTAPCGTCQTTATTCLSCTPPASFTYNSGSHSCTPICDSSCLTCNSANNPNDCASCNNGFFLNASKQCVACTVPCATCQTNATTCLSCTPPGNYNYNSGNHTCTIKCDPSCLTCNTPNNVNDCASCSNGFFLNASKQCVACTAPCATCQTSATTCQSCTPPANYTYNSGNNTCTLKCDSSCLTCNTANNASDCASCNNGYFLNASKQCVACTTPCATCQTTATTCLSCTPPANYTYNSGNNTCTLKCDASCLTCNSANNANDCASCNNGFFLNASKQCVACTAPCATCQTTATKCLSCTPAGNYIYNSGNNTCTLKCDASCLTCNSANNANDCASCNNGFFLNASKQCIACTAPCATCQTTATTCYSCTPPADYTYNSGNNTCTMKCDSSCSACSLPNNSSACTSCPNGSFLNGSNQCIQCAPPCGTCQTAANQCLSCSPPADFTYDPVQHKCLSSCDSSCLTCNSASNANDCKTCYPGYFLNASKQCTPCTSPCQNCSGTSTTCTSCVTNYTFDSLNSKCNPVCDSTCATCSSPNNSNSCQSCPNGRYLNGTQCSLCTSPCSNCQTTASTCSSCISNYNYVSANNTCTPICDSTCKTCVNPNDSNSCTSCNSGRYLSGTQCLLCTSPCYECTTSATNCTSCVSNYTYNSSNSPKCTPTCDSSCLTCSAPVSANSCVTCNNGFYLNASNQCKPCVSPCKTCVTSQSKCLSCVDATYSYDSVNFVCNSNCDSSCKTCTIANNANACSSCNSGFYLNGSQCSPCVSPCKECSTSANICTSCVTNYSINPSNLSQCIPVCDVSCKTCSSPNNPNTCLACNVGYYAAPNSTCQPCTSPCKECTTNPTKCTSCVTNYTFNGSNNLCSPVCDSSCLTCSAPNDSTQCLTCPITSYWSNGRCLTCSEGYYLNTNTCLKCSDNCKSCKSAYTCDACNSGYTLNSTKTSCSIPKTTCHYSCQTCLDSGYYSCTTCASNRVLKSTYQSNIGECICPSNTTDTNHSECEDSPLQNNLKVATTSIFISSVTSTSLAALASANPLIFVSLVEFSQTVSFFTYVNKKPALGYDQIVQNLYYSHITKILKCDSLVPSSKSSRILQQISSSSSTAFDNGNSKIPLNDKYPYFLANSILLVSLNVFVWFISFLASLIKSNDEDSLTHKVKRVFFISLPIVVFVLSAQEFSLLIFFQFNYMGSSDGYQTASSILGVMAFFFLIGFLCYLFYKIEYKKVLIYSNTYQKSLAVLSLNNKVAPIEILANNKKLLSQEQEMFYILFKYIKQDSFLTRNFVIIIVLRKIISSIISVYGFQSPLAQIILLLGNYSIYWLYIILVRPFVQLSHAIQYTVLETAIFVMHILYLVLVMNDGNTDTEKMMSLIMIILTIIIIAVYFIMSLIFLIKFIYNWIQGKQNASDEKVKFEDPSQLQNNSNIIDSSPKKINNQKYPPQPTLNQQPNSNQNGLLVLQQSHSIQQGEQTPAIQKQQQPQQQQYVQNKKSRIENHQLSMYQINSSKVDLSQSMAMNDTQLQRDDSINQNNNSYYRDTQNPNNDSRIKNRKNRAAFNNNNSQLQVVQESNKKYESIFDDDNSGYDSPAKQRLNKEEPMKVFNTNRMMNQQSYDDYNYRY